MAHIHSVYDTDAHFKIDAITRMIKNDSSSKTVLIQSDHNSERFTFEVPRMADGHDLSLCNRVQVHYINIDSMDKTQVSSDVHEIDDLQISPDSDDIVICSWLIDGKATVYAGSLNFLLKFKCVSDDGTVDYVWNTEIFKGISVSSGIDNGEAIVEDYSDILEQWRRTLVEAAMGTVRYTPQALSLEQKQQARNNIGVESNYVPLLEENTYEFTERGGYYGAPVINADFALVLGERYIVKFNGVEYVCMCSPFTATNGEVIFSHTIGFPEWLYAENHIPFPDEYFPFFIAMDEKYPSQLIVIANDEESSHSVGIYRYLRQEDLLPEVDESQNNKFLQVVGGMWTAVDAVPQVNAIVANYVSTMFVPVTQEEYDALVDAGTMDETKYYMIVGDSA